MSLLLTLNIFHIFSSVSFVNFEHVIAGWVGNDLSGKYLIIFIIMINSTQPTITCSKTTIETLEQRVEYAQS